MRLCSSFYQNQNKKGEYVIMGHIKRVVSQKTVFNDLNQIDRKITIKRKKLGLLVE